MCNHETSRERERERERELEKKKNERDSGIWALRPGDPREYGGLFKKKKVKTSKIYVQHITERKCHVM